MFCPSKPELSGGWKFSLHLEAPQEPGLSLGWRAMLVGCSLWLSWAPASWGT